MKKLLTLLLIVFALNTSTTFAAARNQANEHISVSTKSQHQTLVNRVYEIRDMNKASLTASEKLMLRNELNDIKNKLSDPNFTGLYLSSGVIIIILIVLLVLALS